MKTYLYPLIFDAPVRFGVAETGGKLEQSTFTMTSDALFGAICCELAQNGCDEELDNFIQKTSEGKILISDLFPYTREKNEFHLYLPKPVLTGEKILSKTAPLAEVKKDATERKKQKKTEYITAMGFENYLKSLKGGAPFSQKNDFGSFSIAEKVNCREEEPLPYYVGSFKFYDNAGLYLTAAFENEKDAKFMKECLKMLGLSGIGGKRSSGYGKFHTDENSKELENFSDKDAKTVNKMLKNEKAPWQMNLSSLIPKEEDIDELASSMYKLKKRGGFITTQNNAADEKKNSVFVLAAGSCFPKRLSGKMVKLCESAGHNVYRLGLSMYVGLSI